VNGWINKDEGGWEICWTTLPEANKHVGNFVAVRRATEGTASARRLLCSALLLVTAVDFALTNKKMFNVLLYDIWDMKWVTLSCKT